MNNKNVIHFPKTRNDFLKDLVHSLVKRRHYLGMTQDVLNYDIGVAERLVSKWECGTKSPTAFNLYCWADALKGRIIFTPNDPEPLPIMEQLIADVANDNIKDLDCVNSSDF